MMEPRGGGNGCVVCRGRSIAKYRCPACRERYCSVPCYKKHKEQCTSKVDLIRQSANSVASHEICKEKLLNAEGTSWSVDDILTEEDDENDKVPLQKLQLLGKSEELQGLLYNPHLQQLLVQVDQAEDKNALLRKCMQEPLLVEFADCCLQMVEPPEKENQLPD